MQQRRCMTKTRIALPVLVVAFAAACNGGSPGRGDSLGVHRDPLTVPSGDPYLDFDQNASDSDEIALTFDDGPDVEGNTAKVLDTLKAKGVKATFFVNTNNAVNVAMSSTARHLLQRMVAEGHEVGNHTVHHYDLNKSSVNVESEMMGVQSILREYAPDALSTRLFRAPFGNPYFGPQSRLDYVSPIAARHGVHIGWNIDSLDADSCSTSSAPQTCVKRNVLNAVDKGKSGIVLLHCIQPATASVLGSLIDDLRARGKRFVQVESMVKEKYGKASRYLVHCKSDIDCSPGDVCSASTNRCVASGSTTPPPPPPPADGDWAQFGGSPLAGRRGAALAWTGSKAFVWSGESDDGDFLADGAVLDDATRTWSSIPRAPLSGRADTAVATVGQSVFVFGGRNGTYSRMRSAAMFDTQTAQWSQLPSAPYTLSCHPQAVHSPATHDVIVYGCIWNSSIGHYQPKGLAYNLDRGDWREIAASPLTARDGFALAMINGRMMVWAGANEVSGGPNGTAHSDGAFYDPASDSWSSFGAAPVNARYGVSVTVSGNRAMFLGGFSSRGDTAYGDGAIFDGDTSSWRALPSMPTPHVLSAVATDGARLFTWGGTLASSLTTSRGYVLDLASGNWTSLPSSPLAARTMPLGAWDGSSFIVVGGERSSLGFADAASYKP
jgi:peptidoglycan/xylan/chitin deacetylase (PgdA/CDA1 family)